MADGTAGKYASNANKAAAGAPQCAIDGCDACVKAGLPVLLVRPGLAEASFAARQQGAISPLLPGVADPKLNYMGHVMRTLRKGYVYAYYEKPHTSQIKAQNGWQVFEVDEGGYLTPTSLAAVPALNTKVFSCKRTDGYAAAMLFVIPDAKNTGRVWVGFSDHPWSKTVRDGYAANEPLRTKRMACINAPDASCERSLPLTVDNLHKAVADYVPDVPLAAFAGNPFQRRVANEGHGLLSQGVNFIASLLPAVPVRKESAQDVWLQAKVIADRSAGVVDIGKAKIVSIPDAIGATHEAAQLRITLCSDASNWLAGQADGYWRLQTALTIDGLLKLMDARGEQSKSSVSNSKYAGLKDKLVSTEQFEAMKKSGQLPPEAELAGHYVSSPVGPVKSYGVGTIYIPSTVGIDRKTGDLKSEILDNLSKNGPNGMGYQEFLDAFNKKAKADNDRRVKVEMDHKAWLDSDARKLVTEHDFDENTPQDGVHYAGAVSMVTFGGPLTESSVTWFESFLQDDPNKKDNLIVRALLGNQQSFFNWFKELDQKSKTTDEFKGLFDLIGEIEEAQRHAGTQTTAPQRALYRSIPALRNLAAAYANPLVAAAGATSMALNKVGRLTPVLAAKLTPLAQSLALKSANIAGLALLKVRLPFQLANRMWRTQMGAVQQAAQTMTRQLEGKQVKSLVVGGAMALDMAGAPKLADALVDVYLWTKELPDKVGSAAAEAGKLPGKAAEAVGDAAKSAAAAMATYAIRPAEANIGRAWAGAVRLLDQKGITALAKTSTQLMASGTATMTLASGWLQCLVIAKSWKEYGDAVTGEERQKAAFSLLSAGLGVAAAAMELGKLAAEKAARDALVKRLAWGVGIASGVASLIDSLQSSINATNEYSKGDKDASAAYTAQAVLFFGAAVAVGAATYAGAGGTLIGVGFGLSWTGWGLLLVALGMAAGFIAMLLDDTPTEEWTKRCIWSDEASDKWGSLKREQEELNKILIGVRVDFDFSPVPFSFRNLVTSASMSDGVSGGEFVSEARLRVSVPETLLGSLQLDTGIHPHGNTEQRKTWKVIPGERGQEDTMIGGPSFSYKKEQSKEDGRSITVETVQIATDAVSAITATVKIYDAPVDGDLIVDEALQ